MLPLRCQFDRISCAVLPLVFINVDFIAVLFGCFTSIVWHSKGIFICLTSTSFSCYCQNNSVSFHRRYTCECAQIFLFITITWWDRDKITILIKMLHFFNVSIVVLAVQKSHCNTQMYANSLCKSEIARFYLIAIYGPEKKWKRANDCSWQWNRMGISAL